MSLTERQRAILAAIIEQYAEIAAPVGSVTLAKLFGVSSATIRSEMARLEGGLPPTRDIACMSTTSPKHR